MTNETRPTNRQVFDYYASRNQNQLVQLYHNNLKQNETDEYQGLYRYFCNTTLDQPKNPENISFQSLLSVWKHQSQNFHPIQLVEKSAKHFNKETPIMSLEEINQKLNFLITVDDLHVLHPELDGEIEENQKWHLLVSTLAYKLVCGYMTSTEKKKRTTPYSPWFWDDPDDYWKTSFKTEDVKTPFLRLWMVENVTSLSFQNTYTNEIRSLLTNSNEQNKSETLSKLKGCKPRSRTEGLINIGFNYLIYHWDEATKE
ncbi:hypothetical protein [Lacticaseibacillus porcinae]|uniref:hypothetical protein n=1 Tax=Lacticaseibacillus porcinae TaxID=1123687 RepID=UPI000F79FAE9|nr:hypothetical protein [Lacticaseibacillus porcinae]